MSSAEAQEKYMNNPNETVEVGSRVRYRENPKLAAGTIVNILLADFPFVVKWDHVKYNDVQVDQYKGDQLIFDQETGETTAEIA